MTFHILEPEFYDFPSSYFSGVAIPPTSKSSQGTIEPEGSQFVAGCSGRGAIFVAVNGGPCGGTDDTCRRCLIG